MASCADSSSKKLTKAMPLHFPSGVIMAWTPFGPMDPNGAKSRYKCTLAVSAGKPATYNCPLWCSCPLVAFSGPTDSKAETMPSMPGCVTRTAPEPPLLCSSFFVDLFSANLMDTGIDNPGRTEPLRVSLTCLASSADSKRTRATVLVSPGLGGNTLHWATFPWPRKASLSLVSSMSPGKPVTYKLFACSSFRSSRLPPRPPWPWPLSP
mmetsp:Transcript_26320/g.74898  ORF Transcript_26320/g.74898 Transcript_26320/m.74898 type:complete len:209 (-) Transcript_26320:110-736(-)